jgi:hypothetical protein
MLVASSIRFVCNGLPRYTVYSSSSSCLSPPPLASSATGEDKNRVPSYSPTAYNILLIHLLQQPTFLIMHFSSYSPLLAFTEYFFGTGVPVRPDMRKILGL